MQKDTDLAWLSGFVDGEGSVGLTLSRGTTIIPTLQVTTTCSDSCQRIVEVLEPLIGRLPSWSYQEKRPEIHKDSYYVRVTGMRRISKVARALIVFSTTKRRHWELLIEFMEIRIALCGADENGNIKRGGKNKHPYGKREHEIYQELKSINKRGPREGDPRQLSRPRIRTGSGDQRFTKNDLRNVTAEGASH